MLEKLPFKHGALDVLAGKIIKIVVFLDVKLCVL
jgi:hypothetical protein